jgi:predicted dehydrogenase
MPPSPIRFSVIGLNHDHIYGMTTAVKNGGGTLVAFHAPEDDLAKRYSERYPEAKRVTDKRAILEDNSLQLILSASISSERAGVAMEAMRHGKDVLVDKPGVTTFDDLAALRRTVKETKRRYAICFSERLEQRATVKAAELVKAGAIGKVLQTVGLGPHHLKPQTRPAWFFNRAQYGGILCDIASHQFDQFLYFTGSTRAEVVASQVGNLAHPQYPELEDFGDALLRGDGGTGYLRIDWFTPDGLGVWGDGRLTILGSEGYIELRKYTDLGGRAGANHLFLADQKQTRYIDCNDVALPFGKELLQDILERTDKALPQEHTFLACELALTAQARAQRITSGTAGDKERAHG